MPNNELFGSKKRDADKKKAVTAVQKKSETLIAKHLPELFKADVSITEESYNFKLERLLHDIEFEFDSVDSFRIARNYLARKINDGNKQEKWSLNVPPYIVRQQREGPLKTMNWFKNSRYLNSWVKKWYGELNNTSAFSNDASSSNLLEKIIISAAIHGGLCVPDALVSLVNLLATKQEPLNRSEEILWIDLYFNSSKAHNVRIEEQEKTLRRWYPDPISIGLILNFLKVREEISIPKPHNLQTCWKLIKNYLFAISDPINFPIKNFSSFCIACAGVLENHDGINLHQAMFGYAVDKISSSSLTSNFQEALFSNKTFSPVYCSSFNIPVDNMNKHVSKSKNKLLNYEALINSIKLAIAKKSVDGTKNTPKVAITKLEELLNTNLPEPIEMLINWYIDLLSGDQVSTVIEYNFAIGTDWITETLNAELESFDESDFEDLYLSIIDRELSPSRRNYILGRLSQFHLYLVRHYYMPVLTNFEEFKNGLTLPFIRVGFISESMFTALCISIDNLSEINKETKKGIKCLLILAYRLGMRRSELLKLCIEDIEQSAEIWVFVRNNKFGDNKTYSSLRKIPLDILLLPDESNLVSGYIAQRRQLVNYQAKALLFSLPQTPYIPL